MRVALTIATVAISLMTAGLARAQTPPDPVGYLAVSGWYKDLGVQARYQQAMLKSIHQHGYQKAVVGLPGVNLRVIEGNWAPRFLLLASFPNERKVKEFWWSDDYQEARKIRLDDAHLDVAQIDGLPGATPTMGEQSAYLVFFARLQDRDRFIREYAPFAPAVAEKHGGRFLVRAGRENIEALEGNWLNASMVVLEFPTIQALRTFWDSEEYRRLSDVRKATGLWSVIEIAPMPKAGPAK